MAWYSYTLAFAIPADDAAKISDAAALQSAWSEGTPFIHTASRNGTLLATLQAICTQWQRGDGLYLHRNFARLERNDIDAALAEVKALLDSIDNNPSIVVEATKVSYTPTITLHSAGFQPLQAEMVYPSDAVIKDGYVYLHTEDQVRKLLGEAVASQNPCPVGDDDGESLEYVFGFLKSHLRLLQMAAEEKLVVVYGELN
ncbi:MAG: hypothetical protein U0V87_10985 [Acidobacteriota bacterium]